MKIQHVYQMLLLMLELLNLGLQFSIHTLQLLRLLGDKQQLVGMEPRSSKEQVATGWPLGHIRAHRAGNGLQRNALGSMLQRPTQPGQQH